MKKALVVLVVVILAAGAVFWWLSAPQTLAAGDLPDHSPDVENGRLVFDAAGCASCHAEEGAADDARLLLAGGRSLQTPLGAIAVPNISPDTTHGIGGWSTVDFVNALTEGVSPEGSYYVPAFPWTSYRGMRLEDAIDLKAYLDTLPPSDRADEAGGLPFPLSFRRPIGLWKRFLLPELPAAPAGAGAVVGRGHYLTVALGHCSECHTPRDVFFAPDTSRWLAGGPSPDGEGQVPNITPSADGIGEWSAEDIAYMLESGFTPEYDSVGGEMSAVVLNWANVPAEDRAAVAAYLKAIPPLP